MKPKIAFDFHGVLEKYPIVFQPMLYSLMDDHEIYVLSGPPKRQIMKELFHYGYKKHMHFDDAISVVDWIKLQNVQMRQHTDGSWYCDDDIWWSSKAEICRERGIGILFDDKIEYSKYIEYNYPLFIHIK